MLSAFFFYGLLFLKAPLIRACMVGKQSTATVLREEKRSKKAQGETERDFRISAKIIIFLH